MALLWWEDPAVVGRPRCGGTLDPAVVGRPRCGGETRWWEVVRFLLKTALTGRPPYGNAPCGQTALREGPFMGRLLTRRPLTNYRKAYGKLRGGTLPELGGNFRLCAVDQKRPFFLRVERFLDLLPFKGPFPLTGALTGRPPYGKAPYGTGRLLTRRPLTNYRKAYGKLRGGTLPELGGNFRFCAVNQKRPFFLGLGRFWTFYPLRDLSPLQGPLWADCLTGRPLTGPCQLLNLRLGL